MAIYAIGDIQGCYDELVQLLDKINYDPSSDRLWFTGDIVNRGPKSLETLRMIKSMDDTAIVVLGNHDLHLLATAYDHRKPGKKDTLDELLSAPDVSELLQWLRERPLMHYDENLRLAMVHAGLHPKWTIEKALTLAKEVEAIIQGDDHVGFYRHMYGDKPKNWSDKLNGWSRLRFITNILTRLRYCDSKGNVSMSPKGPPGSQPDGLLPWFEVAGRQSSQNRILFGHWSTLTLTMNQSFNNTYPLDTGCLWGGKLTALQIDSMPYRTIQVSCPEASKPSGA